MRKYTEAEMRELFKSSKNVAVVGLSPDEFRPSHGVALYLKRAGFRIIPVNPSCDEVLGEKSYPTLKDIPDLVDIVDIFRRSEAVPEIVEEAIVKGAKVIWMQEGVVNEAAAQRAEQSGMKVVMDRCILKEHRFLVNN
jgi:uncharacterized protein